MLPQFLLARPEHRSVLWEMMGEFYHLHQLVLNHKVGTALDHLLVHPDRGLAWLMYLQDALVGYGVVTFGYSLELGGEIATIDELYIRSVYQGQGIRSEALKLIEAFCRSQSKSAIVLEAIGNNEFDRQQGYTTRSGSLSQKVI